MDRCALAHQYHQQGYSCAQSVAGAFSDLIGWEPERLFAAAGSFGGGVGGSHEELCGAVSGGLLVLGLLFPHTQGEDRDGVIGSTYSPNSKHPLGSNFDPRGWMLILRSLTKPSA